MTAYILMEYVDGDEIDVYSLARPQDLESLFEQAIDGFSYLQGCGILHRDIRAANLLVDSSGVLRIIDFGFGKQIEKSVDFDRSISLNWAFEPPAEMRDGRYDFGTEVYFVGRLFEAIVAQVGSEEFRYATVLTKMCDRDPERRFGSFAEISAALSEQPKTQEFSDVDLSVYRNFAGEMISVLSALGPDVKFVDDVEKIRLGLEGLYKRVMLEEYLPHPAACIRPFVSGTFYFGQSYVRTSTLQSFIELLRGASVEKRKIVLDNIQSRLEAVPRRSPVPAFEDDIPF